jgi:hypothetical protein
MTKETSHLAAAARRFDSYPMERRGKRNEDLQYSLRDGQKQLLDDDVNGGL